MTPEQLQQFEDMKSQIINLTNILNQKSVQQISFPLDDASRNTVLENVPIFFTFTSGSPSTNGSISVTINGQTYKLMTTA
jgi:hypothetical protein